MAGAAKDLKRQLRVEISTEGSGRCAGLRFTFDKLNSDLAELGKQSRPHNEDRGGYHPFSSAKDYTLAQ